MASAFQKDITRTIRNNIRRFVSIMVITILGVAMFCGLRASCEDLRAGADDLFDSQNLFDIQVLSTLGLTEVDVDALSAIEGVEYAEGGFTETATTHGPDGNASVDVKALSDRGFNQPYVLEGTLPSAETEVAVTQKYLDETGKALGDSVEIDPAEDSSTEVFERQTYTIVGVVIDPMDVNNSSGTMSFRSTGASDYTFFVPRSAVTSDTFTAVYIKIVGVQDMECYSAEYEDAVAAVADRIEAVSEERAQYRTDSVKGDAQAELDDAWAEYQSEKDSALQDIADAQAELDSAKQQLDAAAAEIAANQKLIDENKLTLDQGKQELSDAQAQLDSGRATYESAMALRTDLAEQLYQANALVQIIDGLVPNLESDLQQAQQDLTAVTNQIAQEFPDGAPSEGDSRYEYYQELIGKQAELAEDVEHYKALKQQRDSLVNTAIPQLQAGIDQIDQQTAGLSSEMFDQQQTLLNAALAQLESGQADLAAGQEELDQGRAEYLDGLSQWQSGSDELAQGLDEANQQFADAEEELNNAQADIDAIEPAQWYVQDRTSLSSYSSIQSDANSIEALGTAFPLIFLVVGILVSLTAVTRMVEEERGLIGTYKALGYRNREVYAKYLVYAFAACASGCVLGLLCGFVVLPLILFIVYQVMYLLPAFPLLFDPLPAAIGSALFLVGIVGTSFVACRSEVRQKPAALMRPKPPQSGSRILLERVTPVWKRLSFLNKVTARNLLRYKRRFLMTVIGVMGCTALLVCGFAIKDSVAKMVPQQYGTIDAYDAMAVADANDLDAVAADLGTNNQIHDMTRVYLDSGKIINTNGEESIQILVVPDGQTLDGYINLREEATGASQTIPEEGVLVTFNASSVLDFGVGDTITLQDSTLHRNNFEVAGITENYLGNYAYMSQSTYEETFGPLEENTLLVKTVDGSDNQALVDTLSEDDRYLSVTSIDDLSESFQQSVMLLNMVVAIILVMAAALAFTVLFTLSTTNISERERELATIKVLGFRPKEVHHYVNKETLILTAIGVVFGLPLGYVLGDMVLSSLKMPSLAFIIYVEPLSYVIAAALTMLFALVVNLITNRTLDKIDMISALKSVE